VDRLERLRGALDLAQRVPARVEQAGALGFLRRELARDVEGVTTVVWHSVVWQYLDEGERREVDALLDGLTRRDNVAHVAMEPVQVGGGYRFQVHMTRGGRREHVADCEGHGPPVRWLTPS
jgi:hypothetical protein